MQNAEHIKRHLIREWAGFRAELQAHTQLIGQSMLATDWQQAAALLRDLETPVAFI